VNRHVRIILAVLVAALCAFAQAVPSALRFGTTSLGSLESTAMAQKKTKATRTAPSSKARKESGEELLVQLGKERRVQAERELLGVIRSVLSNQLEPGQYLVTLTSELDIAKLKANFQKTRASSGGGMAPSVDDKLRAETFFESMPKDTFYTYLLKVNVRLFLDKSLPDNVVKVISDLVERQAGLRKESGDKLTVEKSLDGLGSSSKLKARVEQLMEDLGRARSEKDSTLAKVEALERKVREAESGKAMAEAQKIQLETQSRVSDNLKVTYDGQMKKIAEDLAIAKEEKKKLEERLVEMEKAQARKISDASRSTLPSREEKPDNSPLGKFKKLVQGAEIPLTILPIGFVLALLILVVGLLFVSSQNKRTRRIMEGVSIIAQALQSAGENRGGGNKDLQKLIAQTQLPPAKAGGLGERLKSPDNAAEAANG
jgi:hypothetical protein